VLFLLKSNEHSAIEHMFFLLLWWRQHCNVVWFTPLWVKRVSSKYFFADSILHFMKSTVKFIMATRHHIRNSEFMKAVRDMHLFIHSRRKFENKKNKPVLRHTAIMECLLEVQMVRRTCSSPGKKRFCLQQILL
jgi:hypothetical protein